MPTASRAKANKQSKAPAPGDPVSPSATHKSPSATERKRVRTLKAAETSVAAAPNNNASATDRSENDRRWDELFAGTTEDELDSLIADINASIKDNGTTSMSFMED